MFYMSVNISKLNIIKVCRISVALVKNTECNGIYIADRFALACGRQVKFLRSILPVVYLPVERNSS